MKEKSQEFVNLVGKNMTDPISSMIIMLKNASNAGKASFVIPFSSIKLAIAKVLEKEGYVSEINKKTKNGHPALELTIGKKVTGVERISKPSRRMYIKVTEIRKVKNGTGTLILTTPKGIMTGVEARKEMVGGEPLFNIW